MNTILFNTEMTKAILEGRKVQTRRVVKIDDITKHNWEFGYTVIENNRIIERSGTQGQPDGCGGHEIDWEEYDCTKYHSKYQIGETIELFEEGDCIGDCNMGIPCQTCGSSQGIGIAQFKTGITIKVTDVRVERLQDMHQQDFRKEGARKTDIPLKDRKGVACYEHKTGFIEVWNKTAPKGYKWEDNPYVFVYEFERVENER